MNSRLLSVLETGATVVTATRRLRHELHAAHESTQLAAGKSVWPTPRILTWDGWLQSLWHRHSVNVPTLCLSDAQLEQLLIQIIEQNPQPDRAEATQTLAPLRDIPAAAQTALEAWRICHQWRIDFHTTGLTGHIDHICFSRWAGQLANMLAARDWISQVEIPDSLMQTRVATDQTVVLTGFDDLNTQQNEFIEFYHDHGGTISQSREELVPAPEIRRFSFDSTREEWRHIGAWARARLQANPNARLAIVTPDPHSICALASDALLEQLAPDYFETETSQPFHFSQGEKLTEIPLVIAALDCLSLLDQVEFSGLSRIFLSPYWGTREERLFRAQALQELPRKIAYRLDLFELVMALPGIPCCQNTSATAQVLLAKLNRLQALRTQCRGVKSIADWVDIFNNALDQFAWPSGTLNSVEYQALEAWRHCLGEWLKLDLVCHRVALGAALSSLRNHCRNTIFQARAPHPAPVQVMGVLEVAELQFDAAWLAGFDAQAWPPVRFANPLLPVAAQIKAGVPAAALERQAEIYARLTARLCALCDEVNLSHAHIQGDLNMAISPLMPPLPCSDSAQMAKPFSCSEAIRAGTPPLIEHLDEAGLELTDRYAPGGSGAIRDQAGCPFRAYATHRLKIDTHDDPEIGIDAGQRGSVLHKILESIWLELKDSDHLQEKIEQGSLGELTTRHIRAVLPHYMRRSGLHDGWLAAETSRLDSLLTEWLMLEAKRPAFRVETTEQKLEYQIEEVGFNLKLDRIDRLSSGSPSRIIIDYKSGRCALKDWSGDRPAEPQVPFYYLALAQFEGEETIDGLAFAKVRRDECELIGISRDDVSLYPLKRLASLKQNKLGKEIGTWSNLKPSWTRTIRQLVTEFRQGIARVDPVDATTCTFCHCAPLCRIHTLRHQEDDANAD